MRFISLLSVFVHCYQVCWLQLERICGARLERLILKKADFVASIFPFEFDRQKQVLGDGPCIRPGWLDVQRRWMAIHVQDEGNQGSCSQCKALTAVHTGLVAGGGVGLLTSLVFN